MLVPALPTVLIGEEDYILASTSGALNAIGPAPRDNVFAAVVGIGEKLDCFLKAGGFGGAFHTPIVPDCARLVK
jgi:hypothetical protein